MILHLALQNGKTLELDTLYLFDADLVESYYQLNAQAQLKLKRAKTGAEGAPLMDKAHDTWLTLMQQAKPFNIADIENISLPYPEYWTARAHEIREIDPGTLTKQERQQLKLTYTQKKADTIQREGAYNYIHNGSSFIVTEHHGQPIFINWNEVAGYSVR